MISCIRFIKLPKLANLPGSMPFLARGRFVFLFVKSAVIIFSGVFVDACEIPEGELGVMLKPESVP
jgi:hypothetical protein